MLPQAHLTLDSMGLEVLNSRGARVFLSGRVPLKVKLWLLLGHFELLCQETAVKERSYHPGRSTWPC